MRVRISKLINKNINIRYYNNSNNINGGSKITLNAVTMVPGTSINVNTEINKNPLETNFSTPNVLKSFGSRRRLSSQMSRENDEHVNEILNNNKRWVEETKLKDPEFFERLGKLKQKPKYLYFGCSDSRVPANQILGLGPGEVFVHRNIANMVPANDLNVLSVLEYAVAHLGVQDIIVAGHYDCGGVRAATKRQDLGLLENWLRLIRDVYRLHKDHLDHIDNLEERHHRLVELNVIEQCLNLYKTGVVQRKRLQSSTASGGTEVLPRIHAMVFNPGEGILKKLNVDFDQRVGSLEHIYGLHDLSLIHI